MLVTIWVCCNCECSLDNHEAMKEKCVNCGSVLTEESVRTKQIFVESKE